MKETDSIASHYNKIKSMGMQERKASQIIALRQANNFLKQKLIQRYIVQNATVFDLGCGKGGDLSKLKHASVREYCGCDIAEESLKEALDRAISCPFKAYFIKADFTHEKIELKNKADLVMAQFSLHYAFASEVSVKKAVLNISNNIKEGGVFIMTVPDKNVILRRSSRNPTDGSFGNSVYKVCVSESFRTEGLFGRGYRFFLNEAVEGCEEYLTDIEYLTQLFKEKGMEKVFDCGFLSLLNSGKTEDRETYEKMVTSTLSKEEIPVIELYKAVAYRKV